MSRYRMQGLIMMRLGLGGKLKSGENTSNKIKAGGRSGSFSSGKEHLLFHPPVDVLSGREVIFFVWRYSIYEDLLASFGDNPVKHDV